MPKKNTGYKKQWRDERQEFEIVWYEKGQRKRKSTGASDGREADKFLTEFIEKQERRQAGRLVEDVIADYMEEHVPHIASPESVGYAVKNLLPFFTGTLAEEINKAKCQEYASWRSKEAAKKEAAKKGKKKDQPISNATIRRELTYLQAALNHDHDAERLDRPPNMWMPDEPQGRDRWFTRTDAAALLRAARKLDTRAKHVPWFVLLSLYSGQRKQAILNLTWDRVDLENGVINWQYGRATNKRRPRQPMPDELKMFLRCLKKYGTPDGYVLNNDGQKVGSIRKGFNSSIKNARIAHATPHTLKHTAITWMLQNGTSPWAVSGFTGTSLDTITRVYGHHASNYLEEARNSAKIGRARRHEEAQSRKPSKRVTAPDTAPNQFLDKKSDGVKQALAA